MLPISVCLIAKNEEKHIDECLKRLQPYGFEIVLADTGSTDRTVELARKYTDRIYHFDWSGDFSAAKNFAMQKASHDWILSLDCDEYLEVIDQKTLRKCMESYPRYAGRILIRNRFTQDGQTSYEQVRVSRFINRHYFHFEGVVHEQLVPTTASDHHNAAPDTSPVKYVYSAPITVLHVGYDGTEDEMREKSKRNITLLEKELETHGADPYIYYQLGQSYRKLHDYETAFRYLDLGLSMDVDSALDYVQNMVESYGYTLLDLKRNQDALGLLDIYDEFATRADFVFLIGLIYMNNGLFDNAVYEFHKASTMEEFAVEGVNSYKANYNIGVICECTGNIAKAREAYIKCGNYTPALTRLEQLP
ncbi:MAG: glycosyltransferase family 2 protein [Lachnospiraceae bacterium]|nr:glycosyltransferase family 2 protein [Lachnospiraceae bacterium]